MASYSKIIGLVEDIRTIKVDENRKSLAIFNTHSTAIVYMKEGSSVGLLNGIPIYPQGNVSLNLLEDGKSVIESWSFISDTITTRIIIFEGQ